ncbi:MAG: hypothetical protein ACI395_02090 [Candidatus Cryptobacteroides sp.]
MNKNILITAFASLLCLFSCTEAQVEEKAYLEVQPEMIESLLGDGDAFNLRISSNVAWTVTCTVDWVVLERTEGTGDAIICGAVKRGSMEAERDFTITVSATDVPLSCEVSLVQGKFVPVIYHFTLAEIMKMAADAGDGNPVEMTEFSVTEAYVASDASAGNSPAGYIVVTDNGKDYLRLVTDRTFAVGSHLEIEMSNATVERLSSGNYALSGGDITASDAAFPFEPVLIDPVAVSSFENCLVTVSGIQCCEDFIGVDWGGDVLMEYTKDVTVLCNVYVNPDAAFSKSTVPENSGSVTGIIAGGKIRPRTLADIGLTADRVRPKVDLPEWKAIQMLFYSSAANVADNISISGTTVTFSTLGEYSVPGKITFGDGPTTVKFGSAMLATGYANTYITSVNWVEGAYIQFELPVDHEISGECEFFTNISCGKANVMPKFAFEWSLDGVSWNKMDAIYSYSTFTQASAVAAAQKNEFSLPTVTQYQHGIISGEFTLSEPVSSGSVFIRIRALAKATSLTQTLRLNGGCVLAMKTVDSDLSGVSVLVSENFESCRWGANPAKGVFMGAMMLVPTSGVPVNYSSTTGWSASNSMVRKGCLFFWPTSGDLWLTSPALSMLTSPTDVTVTFKIVPYVTAAKVVEDGSVSVAISGSGTLAEDIVYDMPLDENPFEWHTGTFKVSGANSDTQISIGKTATSSSRFYLDDVVIRR